MTDRAHALLSASSSPIWIVCTRSPRATEGIADAGSVYAEEGTKAHDVAEQLLNRALGRPFAEIEDADPDMIGYAKLYADFVMGRYDEAKEVTSDAAIFVEQRLDFSHIVPEGFGTGDAVIIADGRMEIIDFKYGAGVPVSARNNSQLMLYALGAYEAHSMLFDIRTVRMTIVQPRAGDGEPKSEEISVEELLAWGEEVAKPAAEKAFRGEGEFVPGEHCRFCKVKATCRARSEEALKLLAYEMKDPALLSNEEIAAILPIVKELKNWAGHVEAYALSEAAKTRGAIPGYKIVEGRSNRKIEQAEQAGKLLMAECGDETLVYKPRELLGISALEKNFSKKKLSTLIGEFITKPPGSPVLVPDHDPRPELGSLEADFKNETFQED